MKRALALVLLFWPLWAHAGDRRAGVILIRADGTSDSGAQGCFNRIRGMVAGDYTEVGTLSLEAFLKKARAEGEDPLTWTQERLAAVPVAPPPGEGGVLDALVLVDCRPLAGVLRATVLANGNLSRLHLTDVRQAAMSFAREQIRAAMWLDFSP